MITSKAFTLVEMLVAMAVTLLMMVALARAFSYVGRQVQESRAVTQLTSELRDVTARIHSDLKQCTVKMQANRGLEADQNGYFMYYEGPLTDATSSLFRVDASSGNPVLPDARYGDCDDYLAFTAVAKPGQWFRGKVPRFLLGQKDPANYPGYLPPVDPNDPNDPAFQDLVVIESKYAEIVYFASPEYYADSPSTPWPTFVDNDGTIDINRNGSVDGDEVGNGFPDRLRIHRRVLLIRPDLNLTASDGQLTLGSGILAGADPKTGLATTVHQRCDLSVRRILDASGRPTVRVAANALSDLSKPHCRFAHYRIDFGDYTSMPILALGKPASVLTKTGNVSPNTGVVSTTADLNGFLVPEFVLGGTRQGEDVFADYAVGFDVQVYDPDVYIYTENETVGPTDAGYRDAVLLASSLRVTQGGFVDLCYPVLSGGSVRGWEAIAKDSRGQSGQVISNAALLISRFSGLQAFGNALNSYSDGLYRSGRVYANGSSVVAFQPTFDTFTSHYERDGFCQVLENGFMKWYSNSPPRTPDLGANGLDDDAQFGADDIGERETLAPFPNSVDSIRISVRLENEKVRLVRQASVEFANN
ncbi:prepilin-type N-terminal cleavage/methylation domain-containing protein [bacterium]|nr:prepilin-type N-terminal cleavage/methylation domain-containing protein [bacterium]